MLPLIPIAAFLLASVNPDPSNARLTMSYDLSKEADDLASKGRFQEACSTYDEAISLGRKPALELGEPPALEWLIRLYCSASKAKLQVDDFEGARSQAWAACVFSQNQDAPSLRLMAEICQATGDVIGEAQAVKQMLGLDLGEDGAKRQELESRLVSLEDELEKLFGK